MDVTKEEFETRAAALVGKCVVQVMYCEIDYGDGLFHFFDDRRFDSLDFGLELTFTDGEQWTIGWGAEFLQYGVSLTKAPISSRYSSPRTLDVSPSPRWCAIIGKRITWSEVFWSWVRFEGDYGPETHFYPQDILLRFEDSEAIVISALEIREEDWHSGMMDNITVFDDIELAKRFHCLDTDPSGSF
jgi:hypothetical protein